MAKKEAKKINKFGLKPHGDRLVLEEVKEHTKTQSGIYIPETVMENDKSSRMAKVVAIGVGKYVDGKVIPISVSVGDTVLFHWGDKIKFEGTEYFIVTESEIIAVIK